MKLLAAVAVLLAAAGCVPVDPYLRWEQGGTGPRPKGQLIPPIVCPGGPETCPEVGE